MELQHTMEDWSVGRSRIRWGAIFAGWVVGLAVQIMLTLLGLAIGAASIDLRESQAMNGIPLGTGIWTGVSMLISAFIGGYIAARLAGVHNRMDGFYHGATVWGVNWLVFAWLTTTALSFMIGGVFSTLGSAVQSIGQGVGTAASKLADKGTNNIDISAGDIRKQIESVLQATGKPELQPGQVKQDVGALKNNAQSGQSPNQLSDSVLAELQQKLSALDRDAAINLMVNKLGMTRAQAEQTAQSTIGLVGPIKQTMQNVKEQSIDVANTTISKVASAGWWLFLLALLTLGVTLVGGSFGIVDPSLHSVGGTTIQDVRRTGTM